MNERLGSGYPSFFFAKQDILPVEAARTAEGFKNNMEQDRNVAKRQRLGKEAKGMAENKGFRPFREAARNEADQLTAAM